MRLRAEKMPRAPRKVNPALLIQPYFDYCSPLYGTFVAHMQLLDKLQKFQNRAARIITGASYEIDSAVVLETLGWETLKSRRQKIKSILLSV